MICISGQDVPLDPVQCRRAPEADGHIAPHCGHGVGVGGLPGPACGVCRRPR